VVLFALLSRRIGAEDEDLIGSCILRVGITSLVMAAAAWGVEALLWHDAGTLFQHAATLIAAILVGGIVFVAVGTKLRVRELAKLLALAANYVGRRAVSAAQT